MQRKPKEIGKVYRPNVPTVSVEFDLNDLYEFQSTFSIHDTFRKELQDGIDYLLRQQEVEDNRPGIEFVIVDTGYADWKEKKEERESTKA